MDAERIARVQHMIRQQMHSLQRLLAEAVVNEGVKSVVIEFDIGTRKITTVMDLTDTEGDYEIKSRLI